jgi:hypothetical protein
MVLMVLMVLIVLIVFTMSYSKFYVAMLRG